MSKMDDYIGGEIFANDPDLTVDRRGRLWSNSWRNTVEVVCPSGFPRSTQNKKTGGS